MLILIAFGHVFKAVTFQEGFRKPRTVCDAFPATAGPEPKKYMFLDSATSRTNKIQQIQNLSKTPQKNRLQLKRGLFSHFLNNFQSNSVGMSAGRRDELSRGRAGSRAPA